MYNPDFLILGEMKCGTTALYNYLIKHPKIKPAKQKELHFFYHDDYIKKGISYYLNQFPYCSKGEITGEGCVQYFCRSNIVIPRLKKVKLNPKFILCFRDPVDRAYSHYNHAVVKYPKKHKRSFESYLSEELLWLERNNFSKKHPRLSFIWHSLYYRSLVEWFSEYPKDQFLILDSKELKNNSKSVCNNVFKFLNVSEFKLDRYPKYHKLQYGINKNKETVNRLNEFFKPENEKLYSLLNKNFGW